MSGHLRDRCRQVLTGRVRGRARRLFGNFILQVEVAEEKANPFEILRCPPPHGYGGEEWDKREEERIERAWKRTRVFWRDATLGDQILLPNLMLVRVGA